MSDDVNPNLADVIDAIITKRLSNMFTQMPGKIVSYDSSDQRAVVQPLIKREHIAEDGTRVFELLPPIPDVPVFFQGTSGNRITMPVTKDDGVLIMCTYNSMDVWLAKGGIVDPADPRTHCLTDAIALMGLRPFKGATSASQSATCIEADELRLGSQSASDPVVRKSDLDAFAAALAGAPTTGPTTGGGLLVAGLAAHLTSQGVPTGSSKVKAD